MDGRNPESFVSKPDRGRIFLTLNEKFLKPLFLRKPTLKYPTIKSKKSSQTAYHTNYNVTNYTIIP